MQRLSRLSSAHGERGAVAIVTAAVVAVVMLGALAISVDVGRMTWERSQTQNAADAGVMTLTRYCAKYPANCTDSNAPTASNVQTLLNDNSYADNLGQLAGSAESPYPAGVCGRGTNLTLCTTMANGWTNLSGCPPLPDWLATGDGMRIPYVEAYTMTASSEGSTLKSIFGAQDSKQITCARAAWGPPSSYTGTVPVTFSTCEWKNFMTSTGSVYAQLPQGVPGYFDTKDPYWPDPKFDRVIYFQNSDKDAPCTNSNGKDNSGGFGDLQAPGCQATVSTNKWVIGDNGKNISTDCQNILASLRGTVLSIPVFDCLFVDNAPYNGTVALAGSCDGSGKGGTANYHIVGWAKFYLTGYVFPGARMPSYIAATNKVSGYPCATSESCVSGWFLSGELSDSPGTTIDPPNGSNDFGAYQVVPAG